MVSTETLPLEQLQSTLRGQLITPDHPEYESARQVYNGMIDRRPAAIARCANVADVITAVTFAREQEMLVAIRSGGHNVAGLGICDDGLVIDLSLMQGIRVDPVTRTARVEAGATLGALDHATHAFGLAAPSGVISTTGVGGITLGGGLGHLTRQYGLAIDNLLEADVVLADGNLVTANEQQHPDLFWALRGGGGNFGVVTSFLFRLHPVDMVYAGPMLWHMDQAENVLRWYREFLPSVPDQLTGFFAFLQVPPGAPFPEHLWNETMCGVVWCYGGPLDEAEAVFAPIRKQFGGPALDFVGPLPFPALQTMFDALYPPGLQWYWKADFFNEITDAAIEQHLAYGSQLPTMLSSMHLYPIDGAAGRIAPDATAWSFRDAKWAAVIIGVSPDPAERELITDWSRNYWEALHPHSAGGAYINFMMDEGNEAIQATYRDHYRRLREVKTRYDPANLFRVNQNIPPLDEPTIG